jgi:hypothetical protein
MERVGEELIEGNKAFEIQIEPSNEKPDEFFPYQKPFLFTSKLSPNP